MVKRLNAALSVVYELQQGNVAARASIGIAVAKGDTVLVAGGLLKHADNALYRAKADGRNSFRLYAEEMDAVLLARRRLQAEVQQAYVDSAFDLDYQPQHRVSDRELIGYEALLRWHHPERGIVSPGKFIEIAEDTGLTVPLTHWVIEHACAEAPRWPNDLSIAVNISTTHRRGHDLVDCVRHALATSGLPPQRLVWEATASALVDRADPALLTLQRLHKMGVRLALDDFGTGYSSLSNRCRLPFNRINIDRSFTMNMDHSEKAGRIVEIVVQLGAALGCQVLAEGVEIEAQLTRLFEHQHNSVQGYLTGRPQPVGALSLLQPIASTE